MFTCLIVEDEYASQEILLDLIKEHYTDIHIKAILSDRDQAILFLDSTPVDLVFLDNHIKGGLGLDVIRNTEGKGYEVIFVTSFVKYALDALNLGAIHYLLKPYESADFRMAVDKALMKIGERKRHLHISGVEGTMIKLDELLCVKSEGVYSVFHMADEAKHVSSKNIGFYEKRLPKSTFLRVHHSWIVNIGFIEKIGKGSTPLLKLRNSTVQVPVSRRKSKEFHDVLNRL